MFHAQEGEALQEKNMGAISSALGGSGEVLEMLCILISFVQNFSLVTLVDINWPDDFTAWFGWMQIFAFDFGFTIGNFDGFVAMVTGLVVAPILIITFDHGIFSKISYSAFPQTDANRCFPGRLRQQNPELDVG